MADAPDEPTTARLVAARLAFAAIVVFDFYEGWALSGRAHEVINPWPIAFAIHAVVVIVIARTCEIGVAGNPRRSSYWGPLFLLAITSVELVQASMRGARAEHALVEDIAVGW